MAWLTLQMESNLLLRDYRGEELQVVIYQTDCYYEDIKYVLVARPAVVKADNFCWSSLRISVLPAMSDGNHVPLRAVAQLRAGPRRYLSMSAEFGFVFVGIRSNPRLLVEGRWHEKAGKSNQWALWLLKCRHFPSLWASHVCVCKCTCRNHSLPCWQALLESLQSKPLTQISLSPREHCWPASEWSASLQG